MLNCVKIGREAVPPQSLEDSRRCSMTEIAETPNVAFLAWCEAIRAKIHTLTPTRTLDAETVAFYQDRYTAAGSYLHYHDLALNIFERFNDLALAHAAFLHGLSCSIVQVCFFEDVDDDVLAILRGREQLASLDAGAHVRVENVLGTLEDPRAAILFVLDRLHHFDASGSITSWVQAFRLQPALYTGPEFPARPLLDRRVQSEASIASFCDRVYAATAQHVGLWFEAGVLRSIALHYRNPILCEEIVRFCIARHKDGHVFASAVARLQTMLNEDVTVQWEWRDPGHIARLIPKNTPLAQWHPYVHRFGFIAVMSGDRQIGYKHLGKLHQAFSFLPEEIRDYTVMQATGGYRMLGTTLMGLVPPDSEQPSAVDKAFRIHIRTVKHSNSVLRPLSAKVYRDLVEAAGTQEKPDWQTIGVFTPKGERIELPAGATVLNLAYKIHTRFVAHLRGAELNKERVGPLHPLKGNEIVSLDIADEPVPLPRGWQKEVRHKRASILREYRRHFRPVLIKLGADFLRQKLREVGLAYTPSDTALSRFVQAVAVKLDKETVRIRPTDETHEDLSLHMRWLRGLGTMVINRQQETDFRASVSQDRARRFVEAFLEEIKGMALIESNELCLPDHVQTPYRDIVWCTDCSATIYDSLSGTIEDHILTLHLRDSQCGASGFAIEVGKIVPQSQFFLVEAASRVGLSADVCRTFAEHWVGIEALSGRRGHSSEGVLRIKVDYLSPERRAKLKAALMKIEAVRNVFMPGEPVPPNLEKDLPPRAFFETQRWQETHDPYIVANKIPDVSYFYGRRRELVQLHRFFTQSLTTQTGQGVEVFIRSPKRIGKSSLAHRFLNRLSARHARCLTLYYEARIGQSWSDTEQRLKTEVRNAVRRSGWDLTYSPASEESLNDMFTALQAQHGLAVVLVVDEAPGLVHSCLILDEEAKGRDGALRNGEVDRLCSFRDRFLSHPKRLLIWAGPGAEVIQISRLGRAQTIFGEAEVVTLDPLSETEVGAMLRAEKMGPRYTIRIPDQLVRRIWQDTAGWPYWVAHLGRSFWEVTGARYANETVNFKPHDYETAKQKVFQSGNAFYHVVHILGDTPQVREVGTLILERLAETSTRRQGLPYAELKHYVSQDCSRATEDDFDQALKLLYEMGGIAPTTEEAEGRWRITAPLLAEYVAYMKGIGITPVYGGES